MTYPSVKIEQIASGQSMGFALSKSRKTLARSTPGLIADAAPSVDFTGTGEIVLAVETPVGSDVFDSSLADVG